METLIVIACNRAITDSGPARNALPKCTRAAAAASTPAQRPEPPLPQSPQSPLKMRGRAERLGRSVARSSAPGLWASPEPEARGGFPAAAGERGIGAGRGTAAEFCAGNFAPCPVPGCGLPGKASFPGGLERDVGMVKQSPSRPLLVRSAAVRCKFSDLPVLPWSCGNNLVRWGWFVLGSHVLFFQTCAAIFA